MKYIHQHIKSACLLINEYNGSMPFTAYLKNHFSQHKKFGSKDRKYISQICYQYFRLGKSAKLFSTEDGIKVAIFLCNEVVGEWELLYDESWIKNWSSDLNQRIEWIKNNYSSFNEAAIFPFDHLLSKEIDVAHFNLSHLIQPDLFCRIRPGQSQKVTTALTNAGIAFKQLSDSSLSLPNGTKLEGLVVIDKELVIQDLSSQAVGDVMQTIKNSLSLLNSKPVVWDCCAASGGKSILAKDIFGDISLTVSDVRESILRNLEKRFAEAGISEYNSFVADLEDPNAINLIEGSTYSSTSTDSRIPDIDLIIVDAPCTGSGTWSRTTEQLFFFEENQLNWFQRLQQTIVTNTIPTLKKGGYLLYITCSVFEKENEAMTAFIESTTSLKLVQQQNIKGYDNKADTMFAALFKN